MSSGSESSFEFIDDNSSISSMEIIDDLMTSDFSLEEAVSAPSELAATSEPSSGHVVKPNEPVQKSPTNLGGSEATTNCWRDKVSMGLRNHIVFKLVEASSDEPLSAADYEHQKVAIAFFRRQENECFEKAGNREEYYYLLADISLRAPKQNAQDCGAEEPRDVEEVKQLEVAEEQALKRSARDGTPVPTESAKPNVVPILEEINGTWMLVARETIEDGVIRHTVLDGDELGYSMKINVQDFRADISTYLPGVMGSRTTSLIVSPNRPSPSNKRFAQSYVEDNQWFHVTELSWYKKMIENGKLRIEFHFGPASFTDVYERVVEKKSSSEASADSEVAKPRNSQTPSVDAAGTQGFTNVDERVESNLATNQSFEPEINWGLAESIGGNQVDMPHNSSESISNINQQVPTSPEPTVVHQPKTDALPKSSIPSEFAAITIPQDQDSRPILNEISGFWKLVAQENIESFFQNVYGSPKHVSQIGKTLKLKAQGHNIETWQYKQSGACEKSRKALLVSKEVVQTSEIYIHDYIEKNQWFTVSENPAEWSVKRIQKGQLRIQIHCGKESFTNVFERAQDTNDDFYPFYYLVITAVISFLLAALIFH